MASKKVPNLPLHGGLVAASTEIHIVEGVVRDAGGNVTNGGNSRRATLAELLALAPGGISQAYGDAHYARLDHNLADLADEPTARVNLGVYSAAQVDALIAAAVAAIPSGVEAARSKPATANFTLDNPAAGVALGAVANGLLLTDASGAATCHFARYNVAPPNAANFTVTMRLSKMKPDSLGGNQCGLLLRNSTNGRLMIWGDYLTNQWLIQAWTGYSTFSGNIMGAVAGEPGRFPWRRVRRVTTDLFFEASEDGVSWGMVFAATAASGWGPASFIEAGGGALDQVGFYTMGTNSSASLVIGTGCQSFTLV